jgi:hypothetical protein
VFCDTTDAVSPRTPFEVFVVALTSGGLALQHSGQRQSIEIGAPRREITSRSPDFDARVRESWPAGQVAGVRDGGACPAQVPVGEAHERRATHPDLLARRLEVRARTLDRERREGTMRRNLQHDYVYGPHTIRNIIETDGLTLQELGAELDPGREDSLLNPWRRSGRAAIRRALGH